MRGARRVMALVELLTAPLAVPVSPGLSATDGGSPVVGADGGVFAFGDASYHGSMGGQPLNAPIVGPIPTPGGGGYLLVACDGGIFAFGAASFYGSMGNVALNQPIVGGVRSGDGSFPVAADGGILAFGPTTSHGSPGAQPPAVPVVAAAFPATVPGARGVTATDLGAA